ncbi:MAG: FAD-dependent oxidoreductase [Chthonomonadales bacterium]|nr:FAD-dependent oxidoreductase [Chthonomonadales bacterium]
MEDLRADIAIVGGGIGGCAAAMAAAAAGRRVALVEETGWLGGQLTSQAVPPDEHPWIERFGCTARYRRFRELVRSHYRAHYPLLPAARTDPALNPGLGGVSRLCCEPRAALAAIEQMLAYPQARGDLRVLLRHRALGAECDGDRVRAVTLRDLESGEERRLAAAWFLDATETGDLLPMTGTEYVVGAEARAETGEPHAANTADPRNVQAMTWCFAMSHEPGAEHLIEPPRDYAFWRDHVPGLRPEWSGRLLDWAHPSPVTLEARRRVLLPEEIDEPFGSLWTYRRIVCSAHYPPGAMPFETSLVNWPQNDYMLRSIVDAAPEEVERALEESRQLSLSLLYWMQTEAPRPDGGAGYPGLFPRPDITGAPLGLARAPYIRESRRIRAAFTVTENHVGVEARGAAGHKGPVSFEDSVGVGCYRIDLHPSTAGDNYIDISSYPFQIPLGALVPVRVANLLPACKNLGVTHITNGCYRLHPVEWNIGEAAGALAAFCMGERTDAATVRATSALRERFRELLRRQGVELEWPGLHAV